MSESTVQAPFEIGELVADREPADGNANPAIIVNCPPQQANEWAAYGDTTVAEDNPNYPKDAPVAVVVYRSELERFDPEWVERDKPYPLTEFNDAGLSYYSFPAPRLEPLASEEDIPAESANEIEVEDGRTSKHGADEPRMTQITYEDTTTRSSSPTDDHNGMTSPSPEADEETGKSHPREPTTAALQLRDRLEDGGMTVEIEPDGRTLAAEKLGETYRVQPGGTIIEGDGLFAQQLASIATDYEQTQPGTATSGTETPRDSEADTTSESESSST
jgi:hypothetical protein